MRSEQIFLRFQILVGRGDVARFHNLEGFGQLGVADRQGDTVFAGSDDRPGDRFLGGGIFPFDLRDRRIAEIPDEAVPPGVGGDAALFGDGGIVGGAAGEGANLRAIRALEGELDWLIGSSRQAIGNDRAARRIFAGVEIVADRFPVWRRGGGVAADPRADVVDVVRNRVAPVDAGEHAHRFARGEEMRGPVGNTGGERAQRREIVQNPDRAPVGAGDQVAPLDQKVVDRRHRQVELQPLPVPPSSKET